MSAPNDREEGLRSYMSSTGIPVEWIRRLLESDTRTDNLLITLLALQEETSTFHEPTVTPDAGTNSPGQQPTINTIGTTIVAEFTPDSQKAYRVFKIPSNFVEDAAFHVHWTKEVTNPVGNTNQGGLDVQWRISYTVFPGALVDLAAGSTGVLDITDTYIDSSADSSRIIYRTADTPAAGFVANYYVGVCVEVVSGGTTMTAEAALISVDLTFTQFINKNI